MRRAIVGLGNPGPRYERTRHNIGFAVVGLWAAQEGAPLARRGPGALWTRLQRDGWGEVFVVEPQLYMNRSGEALAGLLALWRVAPADVLVVHDDVDLEVGRLKLKRGGGTGGHRGLASIEKETGTRDFCRLRFGVGRPDPGRDTADYVLEPFSEATRDTVEAAVERAVDGIRDWLRLEFDAAVQRINARPDKTVESGGSGC